MYVGFRLRSALVTLVVSYDELIAGLAEGRTTRVDDQRIAADAVEQISIPAPLLGCAAQ